MELISFKAFGPDWPLFQLVLKKNEIHIILVRTPPLQYQLVTT